MLSLRELSELSIEITSSTSQYMREGEYTNVLNAVYDTLIRFDREREGERERNVNYDIRPLRMREREMNHNEIIQYVENFKTENEFGFNPREEMEVLERVVEGEPNFHRESYLSALRGITCMTNSEGEILIYPQDIRLAVICGLRGREPTVWEWD